MIKDYFSSYPPIKDYYKVQMNEIYLFRHVYKEIKTKEEAIKNEQKMEELLQLGYTHLEIENMRNGRLKRFIILKSYEVNFIIFNIDEHNTKIILEQFRMRIPNVFEEDLLDYINNIKIKNYILEGIYYKKQNDENLYLIPDYTNPKTNKNNIYHKLRMDEYDTVCVLVKK
jgi:hypothetical protein